MTIAKTEIVTKNIEETNDWYIFYLRHNWRPKFPLTFQGGGWLFNGGSLTVTLTKYLSLLICK